MRRVVHLGTQIVTRWGFIDEDDNVLPLIDQQSQQPIQTVISSGSVKPQFWEEAERNINQEWEALRGKVNDVAGEVAPSQEEVAEAPAPFPEPSPAAGSTPDPESPAEPA